MKSGGATLFLILSLSLSACTNKGVSQGTPSPSTTLGPIVFVLTNSDVLLVVGEQVTSSPVIQNAQAKLFSVSPALPAGISLNPSTGLISGIGAITSERSKYTVTMTDVLGRSAQAAFYLQTKSDMYINDTSTPEVASVSGSPVDLTKYVGGGKGGYTFQIVDSRFGAITTGGIFTPSALIGDASFLVTDNAGLGSTISFTVHIGKPRLSVVFQNPTEGSPLIMNLALSGKSSATSTINYSVSLVSAMASSVNLTPGVVSIKPGDTTAQIQIPTFNNHVFKDDGVFKVTFQLDSNIQFADSLSVSEDFLVTVINTSVAPTINFALATSQVVEYDQSVSFTINLLTSTGLVAASQKSVAVDYVLDPNLSTVQSFDHNFLNGVLTFQPGETSKTISFQLYHDVNGNQVASPDRLMSIKLQNPINATLGILARENITIIDPMVVNVTGANLDFVLLSKLNQQGWNGQQNVLVRIASNAVLRASSSTQAAFSSGFIQLNYPATVSVVNNGSIVGHGGVAGQPIDPNSSSLASACNQQFSGNAGGDGGSAMSVVMALTLLNNGLIVSGGGGGGAGVSATIGNDAICTLSRDRVAGGTGGVGADSGGLSTQTPGVGGTISPPSPQDAVFVSLGGTGGLPAKSGTPGFLPTSVGLGIQAGAGGRAGLAFQGKDSRGIDLISADTLSTGTVAGRNQ